MQRRSFFKRIVEAAAIVALAPRIAFGIEGWLSESEFEYGCEIIAPTPETTLSDEAFVSEFFYNQPLDRQNLVSWSVSDQQEKQP